MKIAIINIWSITENAIGGTERFVSDLAESIDKLGHQVDVYMFSGRSFKKGNINFISLELLGKDVIVDEYMLAHKFGKFDTDIAFENIAKQMDELIESDKYDLLHLNSHLLLKCWGKSNRIFTLHSNYEEFKVLGSDEEYKKMVDIMKEENQKKTTTFVSPSEYYSKEWTMLLDSKIKYIPHALNKKRLVCENSVNELIKKYKLDKNKIKILLPSRLEPIQKQPKMILEACALLSHSEKEKVQIVFTGIDEQYKQYIPELEKYSKKNNIDSKFIIFDAIKEGYKLTDVVCIPSKSESFGYSALESLYLNIPTLLTNIPTYNELSFGNQNAYIFGNSAEELKEKLEYLINNFEERHQSYDYSWLDRYSLDLFGRRYLDIYAKDE